MLHARAMILASVAALPLILVAPLPGKTLQAAQPAAEITALKKMHLDTAMVVDGKPTATVVVPADGRYQALADTIVQNIKKSTGVTLPVVPDSEVTLPLAQNLVILGNRSTNCVTERLYNFYYTYLDLKYPGAGGYVVRSLHNPFATGHNAILVGGSDDAGMAKAAKQFLAVAEDSAAKGALSFNWLLQVELGAGLTAPKNANDPACRAWGSKESPATYFGWNSVGRNMALYYMTGDEKFAREFLRLAFPDEKTIEEIWEVDGERIEDKKHPLAGSYHYCAHPIILLWDLIEESPVFTDEERLRVTREFTGGGAHFRVPGNRFVGDRHGTYQSLMVYCRARYLQKYYPHPAWKASMEAAAGHFASLDHTIHVGSSHDTPDSGHTYVNTGYEPILSYMLISGDRRGVESGMLGTILRGYDGLIGGERDEPTLGFQTLSFANKAAYLTEDARFIYYRNLTSKETDCFRIGQSFWPDVPERAPEELSNRISVRPLSDTGCAGRSVLPEEAFHWLTYRGGPTGGDDYFKIGGMYDQTRQPYYCLNLEKLRIGAATLLQSGDRNNMVIARRKGLMAGKLPLESALKVRKVVGDVAHVEAEVPEFAYGVWRRTVLHAKGRWTVVADQLTARHDTEQLEMRIQWALPITPKLAKAGHFEYLAGDRPAALIPATQAGLKVGDHLAECTVRGDVKAGEKLRMTTLIGLETKDAKQRLSCARLTDAATMLGVPDPVLTALGTLDLADRQVKIDADAVLIGEDFIYAAGVRQLTCGPPLLVANRPVDIYWTPNDGNVALFCSEPTALAIAATHGNDLREGGHPVLVTRISDGLIWTRLDRGDHAITGALMPTETITALRKKLETLRQSCSRQAPARQVEQLPADLATLQPVATQKVEGAVTRIVPGPVRDGLPSVHVVCDDRRIYPLTVDGKLHKTIEAPAKIMSATYWPEAALLLLGGADDRVRAFDPAGKLRWTFQSEMHPDVFDTGKTYWFKKDLPGIYGLKTGNLTGQVSHAFVGSACTVEALDETGKLVKRVPLYWGSCAVMQIVPNADGTRKLVVAKSPNLSNNLSTIQGSNWSTGGFGGNPPFQLSQSTLNILVDDLDADGQAEVICDTNGSMNNVRAYNCQGKPLWTADLGPPAAGGAKIGIAVPSPTMRGLIAVDFQGKGRKQVVTATDEGLLTAFHPDGTQAWAAYLPSTPWSLCALPRDEGGLAAVGCADGTMLLIDATGRPLAKAQLDGAVRQLHSVKGNAGAVLITGTDKGELTILQSPSGLK